MKTLITKVSIEVCADHSIVWTTYKKGNNDEYQGFAPYKTNSQAVDAANEMVNKWDANFMSIAEKVTIN